MPVEGQVLFKSRDDIVADLISDLVSRVPDAYVGEDGNLTLLFQVVADAMESVFMAVQLTANDMFVSTASPTGLARLGEEFGIPKKAGTVSTGTLLFTGAGGTTIEEGTEVAYDPGGGDDVLYFVTVEGDTVVIPNPGIPTAPTITDGGGSGNLVAASYEYGITFVTAGGETALGAISDPLTLGASHKTQIDDIPLGGDGTTARRIYRSKNGGDYLLVHEIADNSTDTYLDNIIDASLGAEAPTESTAERVSAGAQSEDFGMKYNLLANSITILTNAPDGVTDVVNLAPFTGGTDEEDTEIYRQRLLTAIRDPGTGSASDIETWAEAVDGVGHATVFQNDNLGTPTNGHVTVRVSALDGSVPSSDVLDAVEAALEAQDLANVTFHVAGFTSTTLAVTVDVTADTGYDLSDITENVEDAITQYVNSRDAGGTVYIAGIIAAIMAVVGVKNVTVSLPATDQTAADDAHKFVAGTITVS